MSCTICFQNREITEKGFKMMHLNVHGVSRDELWDKLGQIQHLVHKHS